MAKSIRSKWKRKMRGVKRERYAKKELVKLKECASRLEKTKDDAKSLYQFTDPASIASVASAEEGDNMELGSTKDKSKKTFSKLDKNGQYPVWMSVRNVKRLKKANAKKKDKKKKLRRNN